MNIRDPEKNSLTSSKPFWKQKSWLQANWKYAVWLVAMLILALGYCVKIYLDYDL